MNSVLRVCAVDYTKMFKLTELVGDSILQSLPISSYQLPDGTHQVISHYQDDVWRYEDGRFPSNIVDSEKKIHFKTIPEQFVEPAKFAIKNYDITLSPAGTTLIGMFKNLKIFLKYLSSVNVRSTLAIKSLHCVNFVKECKHTISKRTGKKRSADSLAGLFGAVEFFYRNLKDTQYAFEHPWYESSAGHLAGQTGQSGKRKSKTELIKDDELKTLVQHCNKILEQAGELLGLKQEIEPERARLVDKYAVENSAAKVITETMLKPKGYTGLKQFNKLSRAIPGAVSIIILTFSGIRVHELCAIQYDAYRIQDEENEIYYWLKSHSSKTYEGYTEWLVPKIVIDAIEIQKAYIKHLQDELVKEQIELFALDPNDPRAIRIDNVKRYLFLTKSKYQGNKINSLTGHTFARQLEKIGEQLGIKRLTSHRFRRTFAVYVAQSAYGDVRYLKEHFKHWGMDMTLLYSYNDFQSEELYDEIAIEIKNYKIARVEEFLDEDTIISGGLANNISHIVQVRKLLKPTKVVLKWLKKSLILSIFAQQGIHGVPLIV